MAEVVYRAQQFLPTAACMRHFQKPDRRDCDLETRICLFAAADCQPLQTDAAGCLSSLLRCRNCRTASSHFHIYYNHHYHLYSISHFPGEPGWAGSSLLFSSSNCFGRELSGISGTNFLHAKCPSYYRKSVKILKRIQSLHRITENHQLSSCCLDQERLL